MEKFRNLVQKQFDKMQNGILFRSKVTGQEIWDSYLREMNGDVFRDPNSNEYNCNTCKSFFRRYANVVTINSNNEIETIFDVDNFSDADFGTDIEYKKTAKAISDLLKASEVQDVFVETFDELNSLPYEVCKKTNPDFQLGIFRNYKIYTQEEANKFGVVTPGKQYTFNHLGLKVLSKFIDKTGKSAASIMGDHRANYDVFKRAMETLSLEVLELVKDLIQQKSIMDGTPHLPKLEAYIKLKLEYTQLSVKERDNWCWVKSHNFPLAKFRNELMGVLCTELSEGTELNLAITNWNKRVDPANYMKAVAPFTKKQKEEAVAFIQENGYESAFIRRFATLKDIELNQILHISNKGEVLKQASIFDNLSTPSSKTKIDSSKIQPITIGDFMKNILPTATEMEVFLENKHAGNLCSLLTANENSKQIFKWSNPFNLTFNGNLAGKSMIKQNVKAAGGKTTGLLRCSLQWNDKDTPASIDFDLHCKESRGTHIYFSEKKSPTTKGYLDVDMIRPSGIGIENIIYENSLPDGDYDFSVVNFDGAQNKGFKVEIEFNGQVFNYATKKVPNKRGEKVDIAKVTVKSGIISINHILPVQDELSQNVYGLDTLQFHRVKLVCESPNHWNGNNVGNKYYLFMLENCRATEDLRGYHAENLIQELADKRKVLEPLGNFCTVKQNSEGYKDQLSGLGFNETVSDELIVKVTGSHTRVLKIIF